MCDDGRRMAGSQTAGTGHLNAGGAFQLLGAAVLAWMPASAGMTEVVIPR